MIITFASSKGGAGKTTCCASIGTSLALSGERVLMMELDSRQPLKRLSRMLAIDGLTVLALEPKELDEFSVILSAKVASKAYDYILVDVAGAHDTTLFKAMARADLVIIPLQPGEMELHEALVVNAGLKEITATTGRVIPYAILFTAVSPLGSRLQSKIYAEVARHGMRRFDNVFLHRVSYKEMFLSGEAPAQREPEKGAGPEIAAVIAEIRAMAAETTPALTPALKAAS